jgi:hypothetical protein
VPGDRRGTADAARALSWDMLMTRAAQRPLSTLIALSLAVAPVCATSAPIAVLSPDERPMLILVSAPEGLLVVHHAHPMPPNTAERLALRLGLFIAGPIIRRRARESVGPLPVAWRSDARDRGFLQELSATLDRTQANWPWRTLRVVASSEQADALAEQSKSDAAVVSFTLELEDLERQVQLSASAQVLLARAAGTPRESRTHIVIRHLAPPLPADTAHPERAAPLFHEGGPLDQQVSATAFDLSRALAVTIARLTTPTPTGAIASRRYADLAVRPRCAECRPEDAVLHEEPGRVWVAPAREPGTVLSLPR